jgi:ATP-dependent DNA ligase
MASVSVYILDMLKAIKDGQIPGSFNNDRTIYTFPTIRSQNSRGATMMWTIRVRLLNLNTPISIVDKFLCQPIVQLPNMQGEITTETLQEGGKIREGGRPTYVDSGKNIGKKNATNVITQALRDAFSRYNHQLKQKTVLRPPPMLVKKEGSTRNSTLTEELFQQGITIQRKLNGVRLVAYFDDKVHLYSRTGSDYPGFDIVKEELKTLLESPPSIPNSIVYLDGELYKHNTSLSEISGQARRTDTTTDLAYYVFDCFFPTTDNKMPSSFRQNYLKQLFASANLNHVYLVESFPVANRKELDEYLQKFLKENYEGIIVRKDNAPYQYGFHNYHSDNVIKIKPLFDAEFKIVGFTEGIRGKDVGALIWICEVDNEHLVDKNDKNFNVVPKDMTYEERYLVFRCLSEKVNSIDTRFTRDFYGKLLTVEFPERSIKTGKPVQAKALCLRTYENGDNPLQTLYKECSI